MKYEFTFTPAEVLDIILDHLKLNTTKTATESIVVKCSTAGVIAEIVVEVKEENDL